MKRVFLIVLDSFGIGYEPDADLFGDVGANTLHSVSRSKAFSIPNMEKMGLLRIQGTEVEDQVKTYQNEPEAAFGRLREKSAGKDTTVGHWEIAGLISKKAFPVYPNGFPDEIIREFEERTGKKVLCNRPASGTEVIRDCGEEQMKTGGLIVYTSADSVFQVAAHEGIIPVEELYRDCQTARELLKGEHGVARVIARPFEGEPGAFRRTANRHDFSLEPSSDTILDYLKREGLDTIGVGKISDIFAGKGISRRIPTKSNTDGMEQTLKLLKEEFHGLCFVTLVDFDMVYGHRNDVDGYARALNEFDTWLGVFQKGMQEEDVLLVTADHGCDPGFPGTDHTREYIPLLAYGKPVRKGMDLGSRETFADIGKTVLDYFHISNQLDGESMAAEMLV